MKSKAVSSRQHIAELDGIRGLAILMVVCWHFFVCQPANQNLSKNILFLPLNATWSGVDLFFVLSGFLIGGIILENYKNKSFLMVFWIKRACRILPIYLVVCLLCFFGAKILSPYKFKWLFDNLMPWFSYLTFTQNFFMAERDSWGGLFSKCDLVAGR